jgi:hypothetical protein
MSDDQKPTMTISDIMEVLGRGRTATYNWIVRYKLERVSGTTAKNPLYWRVEVMQAHWNEKAPEWIEEMLHPTTEAAADDAGTAAPNIVSLVIGKVFQDMRRAIKERAKRAIAVFLD